MRVDGYNQISQIYSTKKTVKKQDIKKTDSKDQVLISSSGRDYQIAKRAVASSVIPPISFFLSIFALVPTHS